MLVRARNEDDLDRCVEIARAVRQLDGYPPYLPRDLRAFIASPAVCAWVADLDGEVIGHVALHRRSSPQVMALASAATGRPPDRSAVHTRPHSSVRLGVVARLVVSPEARRRGVGRALLAIAANAAVERGLSPILDVARQFGGAVSLYESCGWACIGEVAVPLGKQRGPGRVRLHRAYSVSQQAILLRDERAFAGGERASATARIVTGFPGVTYLRLHRWRALAPARQESASQVPAPSNHTRLTKCLFGIEHVPTSLGAGDHGLRQARSRKVSA